MQYCQQLLDDLRHETINPNISGEAIDNLPDNPESKRVRSRHVVSR
jgi:ubiquitin C-terminal hydrolase